VGIVWKVTATAILFGDDASLEGVIRLFLFGEDAPLRLIGDTKINFPPTLPCGRELDAMLTWHEAGWAIFERRCDGREDGAGCDAGCDTGCDAIWYDLRVWRSVTQTRRRRCCFS
jgi:hypothetical protein